MDPSAPESFERAIGELEQIVQRMESGSLSLEESLGAYRRGATLVAWCRKSLADVQQQVRILEADLLEPFDVDAPTAEAVGQRDAAAAQESAGSSGAAGSDEPAGSRKPRSPSASR